MWETVTAEGRCDIYYLEEVRTCWGEKLFWVSKGEEEHEGVKPHGTSQKAQVAGVQATPAAAAHLGSSLNFSS